MTNEATVNYDPAATDPARIVAAINDTGYVSRLPVEGEAAPADDERERTQQLEYAGPAHESARQPRARRDRDGGLDAADGRRVGPRRTRRRSAVAVDHDDDRSAGAGRAALALRDRPAVVDPRLAGRHGHRDGVGRPPLLYARVGGHPSPLRRHEHVDRGRHGRRVPVFSRGDIRARLVRRRGRAAGRLLRGGDHHHRAGAARQRDGSAGEDADDPRAAAARETTALDRAGAPRRPRTGAADRRRARRRCRAGAPGRALPGRRRGRERQRRGRRIDADR